MLFENIYSDKKVFVTGHTGFKGSWLCEWLLKLNSCVTGFSLVEPPSSPSLFDMLGLSNRIDKDIRGDIIDFNLIKNEILQAQPDFIFHLAAQPIVRKAFENPLYTIETNALGTANVLESIRFLQKNCVAIMITTDKVYENREWCQSYREPDELGGIDPYSSSKACAELLISSYFRSFFKPDLLSGKGNLKALTSVRAGNVIGGGDWAEDRIVPDSMRSLEKGHKIPIRNKVSTRPWQHVLEPLSGYLLLASKLFGLLESKNASEREFLIDICTPFNFGPTLTSNKSVLDLVSEILKHWPGDWQDMSEPNAPHEAGKLNLTVDKAFHKLRWQPNWNFERTVFETVCWYKNAFKNKEEPDTIRTFTQKQIDDYSSTIDY